jgi:hypothetical protein
MPRVGTLCSNEAMQCPYDDQPCGVSAGINVRCLNGYWRHDPTVGAGGLCSQLVCS